MDLTRTTASRLARRGRVWTKQVWLLPFFRTSALPLDAACTHRDQIGGYPFAVVLRVRFCRTAGVCGGLVLDRENFFVFRHVGVASPRPRSVGGLARVMGARDYNFSCWFT